MAPMAARPMVAFGCVCDDAAKSMKYAIPLLVMLAGCQAHPAAHGGGIVSTNPCADAMLVDLVLPSRIAAISHYSQDPGATSMPLALARRFRSTTGTAEEVIALHPDLVVTSSFTPPASRAAYARAGLKVITFDSPTTVAASREQVMTLARAVGAEARGRAMVARIDAALASVSSAGPKPSTLLYISSNLATGPATLLGELMTRAGLHNAAADHGLTYSGTISTERLVADPPALIVTPDPGTRAASRRAAVLQGRTRVASFPRRHINCGGPTIVPAIERLVAIRQGVS